MEIGGQNRQHGSMSFDNIYHRSFPQLRPVRNTTTILPPDQRAFIPTSSPLPVCYTNTGYDDVIGLLQDVPYVPFGQDLAYINVSQMSGFTPSSHGPVIYASIHPCQSQNTHGTLYSDTRIGSYLPVKPTATFTEELNASRVLLALSQDMVTRNIYGPCGARKSADLYSPSADDVESSVEYFNSTTFEFYVSPQRNSLFALAGKGSSIPQCMMNQFSLKKPFERPFKLKKNHKCKICHKQFRCPSSLQMHNYSHTGEKPFMCGVDGCGRRFSVRSNLKRHKNIHKGDTS